MSFTQKQCIREGCDTIFVGNAKQVFCSSTCRWRHHAKEANMAKREKDPEKQRMGRANRRKGANAEREVCRVIQELTGQEVRRNLSQTRDAGGDVKWGPFYLEVKYCKNIAMPAWQAQAFQSASEDGDRLVPAVVHRRPNEPFWINLPFHAFVALFDGMRQRIADLERGAAANAAIQKTVDEVAPA